MKKTIKKITKILLIILAILIISGSATALYLSSRKDAENICNGVIKLDTSTKDTSFIINKCLNLFIGNYNGGKCSSVVKQISNGEVIVGRNLDNTLNNYPIYIGSTDIEGYYKTVYATCLEDLGPTYDSCIEKGVPKYMRDLIPFLASDSLNSEGLYVEMNMRQDQKNEEGKFIFSCSGTNQDADVRLNVSELPTYITLRCKNIEEALDLVKKLDIYTPNNEDGWTLCLTLADANENYGLLEFGCNEIRWLPLQNIQTNYYVSQDFNEIQKYKQGIGRYEYLKTNLNNVASEDDMLKLMEGVRYSEIYNLKDPSFNIRSEFAGDEEYLTNDYLNDDNNWKEFLNVYKQEADLYNSQNDIERRDANYYWVSLYTAITNCTKKTLSLSFYENYKIEYVLKFD